MWQSYLLVYAQVEKSLIFPHLHLLYYIGYLFFDTTCLALCILSLMWFCFYKLKSQSQYKSYHTLMYLAARASLMLTWK